MRRTLPSLSRFLRAASLPLAGLLAMAGHGRASAQDLLNPAPVDKWIVTLGGSVERTPLYSGARHKGFAVMPSIDLRRAGEPAGYSGPDDSLDYTLFDFGGLEIGPVLGVRGGRARSDSRRLIGIHDVDWSLDAGAFVQYWPIEDRLRLRTEVRQALWAGDGLVTDFAVDWFQPVTQDLVLSVGPRASWANKTYMHNNFGISAQDAINNGKVKSFDADAGLKSVGIAIAATYTISPEWSVQVYDRYDRLIGDAASSPITSMFGSRNQNVFGISIERSFGISF